MQERRLDLNAKRSGVLFFCESQAKNKRNTLLFMLSLGDERVREWTVHEHVGIMTYLFEEYMTGVEIRLSKGERAFIALSGIRTQLNGLNVTTYHVFCWFNSNTRRIVRVGVVGPQ